MSVSWPPRSQSGGCPLFNIIETLVGFAQCVLAMRLQGGPVGCIVGGTRRRNPRQTRMLRRNGRPRHKKGGVLGGPQSGLCAEGVAQAWFATSVAKAWLLLAQDPDAADETSPLRVHRLAGAHLTPLPAVHRLAIGPQACQRAAVVGHYILRTCILYYKNGLGPVVSSASSRPRHLRLCMVLAIATTRSPKAAPDFAEGRPTSQPGTRHRDCDIRFHNM